MSGIYITGMEMPKCCADCPIGDSLCCGLMFEVPALWKEYTNAVRENRRHKDCPLVPVPEHGRLIDADALRQAMYHEAFETDSPMQKWDSGCWIRYKMFEQMEESAPTIIPASED